MIAGLSNDLARRLAAFLDGALHGEAAIETLADDLAAHLDGQPVDVLRELLAELREAGGYALSLRLLARAWAGTLSDNLAGEVAQDWIGTLLHGLGDREAAADIARHVTPEAIGRGAAFAADLGDLLLSWRMRDEAAPLLEFAAERNPGDLEACFNLGVVRKFQGRWAESAELFRGVGRHKPDPAVSWNLGIACTALRDFAGAAAAWRSLGIHVPDSDGDYARPGERVPVRLVADRGAPVEAEVVWADRLCPARARLTAIPRYGSLATFGDVILVDGVQVGETVLDGQTVPIVEGIGLFASSGGRLFRLRPPAWAELPEGATATVATALRDAGYAAADWRGVGPAPPAVGVVLPAGGDLQALAESVRSVLGDLPLRCPELLDDTEAAALSPW